MPPTNPVDVIYASGIELAVKTIGHKAAFKALQREVENLSDATIRQIFTLEGAFANDVAELVKEYPGREIVFRKTENGYAATISGSNTLEEAQEIKRRIDEAIERRNKLPGVPEIRESITSTISEVDVPDEE
jgi:hypothetical protein